MTEAEWAAFHAESQRRAQAFVAGYESVIDAGNWNRALIGREADPGDGDDEYAFVMAQAQTA